MELEQCLYYYYCTHIYMNNLFIFFIGVGIGLVIGILIFDWYEAKYEAKAENTSKE